ncbi:hypothetical protein ABPG74_002743 [Tetrahymena malaccensis]
MIKKKDAINGAILPFFGCACNKQYKTLSSLSNHIKYDHEDKQENFRVPRGVPLGRVKKISKYQKVFLKKLFKEQYNENLTYSDQEVREIFKENVILVSNLAQQNQLAQQFQDELLKENIKLQSFWRKINRDQLNLVMEKYFLAFIISTSNVKLSSQQEQQYQNDEVFQNLVKSFQDENQDQDNNKLRAIKVEQTKQEEN